MFKPLTLFCTAISCLAACASGPVDPAIDVSVRSDGRHTSSLAMARSLMRSAEPALAFDPSMPPDSFPHWRRRMSAQMAQLMRHPSAPEREPRRVKSVARDGYSISRWETYPLPGCVVAVYVLVPDGVDAAHPARGAALCIPGFGGTKEQLAGEAEGDYMLEKPRPEGDIPVSAMARFFAEKGLVAVAVDNVSFGELADDEGWDYELISRHLLECGWSYLGMTSWQDKVVLDWMKTLPGVPADRIIVSGFSLGTEPLMALGLLDDSVCAFVYNDFLCRTRERILAMTAPQKGRRRFPNSIEHLIPGFLTQFDFPDIVAALAPRPVICTEGGLDRDFRLVRRAYELAGATADAFEFHHYPKFDADSVRSDIQEVPAGIDRDTYFRLCNVDPPHHCFKTELVDRWLDRILPPASR